MTELYTGEARTGWIDWNGDGINDFYADRYGKVLTGRQYLLGEDGEKHYYYFSRKLLNEGQPNEIVVGQMITGHSNAYDGRYYYVTDPTAGIALTGWVDLDQDGTNDYYTDRYGKVYTGMKYLTSQSGNRNYYFFDSDGKMAVNVAVTISRRLYAFGGDGARLYGRQTILNRDTGDTFTYYFGRSGYALTGWQTEYGKKYYFDSNLTMHYGWLSYRGEMYYMADEDGHMVTGRYHTKDGDRLFDMDGRLI